MDAISILVFVLIQGVIGESDWSFDGVTGVGPADWASLYPLCASEGVQSPIDIPLDTVYDESLTDFKLYGYDTLSTDDLIIENNGAKAKLSIKKESVGKVYFTGGGLQDKYIAINLHVHWGVTDNDGSCHNIHGQSYPMEMHIKHMKEVNGSPVDPPTEDDDVAMLAFQFKLSETDNEELAPYFNALDNIMYKGEKASFGTSFDHFMGKTTEFYRYYGSMGSPPCKEIYVWSLFTDIGTVSSAQLAKLRQLYMTVRNATEPRHITLNTRPLQELGDRTVKRNFLTDSVSAVTASFVVVLCAVISSVALKKR